MTKEEAKELLTHVLMTYEPRDQYGDWDDSEPYEEAIDMAIKALQARTDGDLISRQDVVNAVNSMPYDMFKYDIDRVDLLNKIESLPSAEPKTGRWIEVEVLPEVYDIEGVKTWGSKMQCDQCGFRFTAVEGHISQYNYCPNCGADMRKPKLQYGDTDTLQGGLMSAT